MVDEKVTVIGFKGSGKTCYLAGMYNIMSYGMDGFTLSESDLAQDYFLQSLWENMIDPATRKWPAANDQMLRYNFSLSYAFSEILEFEWLDYPGGLLTDTSNVATYESLKEQLNESACLIIVVNGESFNNNELDKEVYIRKVENKLREKRDLEAVKKLAIISKENGALPPVAIIISKADLIPDDKRDTVEDIIKKNFNPLFIDDNSTNREVCIMLTTLGDNIQSGGELDPINIEQPIAYAVLNILSNYVARANEVRINSQGMVNTMDKSFWRRNFQKSDIDEARKNIQNMELVISKFSKDAIHLMERFKTDKKMYVNGMGVKLHDYYKKKLGF